MFCVYVDGLEQRRDERGRLTEQFVASVSSISSVGGRSALSCRSGRSGRSGLVAHVV